MKKIYYSVLSILISGVFSALPVGIAICYLKFTQPNHPPEMFGWWGGFLIITAEVLVLSGFGIIAAAIILSFFCQTVRQFFISSSILGLIAGCSALIMWHHFRGLDTNSDMMLKAIFVQTLLLVAVSFIFKFAKNKLHKS